MTPNSLKALFKPYQRATLTGSGAAMRAALTEVFSADASVNLSYPFDQMRGGNEFWGNALEPLLVAMPDLERRDMIVLSGSTPEGQYWIGTMGNYIGTFVSPLLGIPATGHLAHMRYHEFFRVENDQIIAMQAIWDLPELMMQAKAWPMAPQLGAFLCTPGPMSCDGLSVSGDGQASQEHVIAMLEALCRHPENPDPAVMQLEKYWHPQFNWYGPAGIGTTRGISGFRYWHQIPFLKAMPDRKLDATADLMSHWIAEGNYVCETGWPNMRLNLTHDGWMGIAPVGKEVCLRSLDFWRMENGLIRENWVLVDLLDMYSQIGVDVLGRLREFNKARL